MKKLFSIFGIASTLVYSLSGLLVFPELSKAAVPVGVISAQAQAALERARPLAGGEPTVDKNVAANNPLNVQRVMRVLPESLFETFFARRNSVYTYENFLKAVKKFPKLCGETGQTDAQCKLELATMFAHFAQETGEGAPEPPLRYKQGLYYVREAGCSDSGGGCDYRVGACEDTLDTGKAYPCPTGRKYYGRGPKQLSYSYNYAPFSVAMTGRSKDFVESPEPVADNGYLAFASALWFYMTPQSPKPSIHEVAIDIWVPNSNDLAVGNVAGFGSTINIINGGLECRSGSETAQASNRITYYNAFLSDFGLTDNRQKSCVGMGNFPSNGAGALNTYWEE
ncbi:MAG TPA: chitinase, partial [Patescibacteria group bacterium]|nr:chitinase [Patescibacteria group bacterium]